MSWCKGLSHLILQTRKSHFHLSWLISLIHLLWSWLIVNSQCLVTTEMSLYKIKVLTPAFVCGQAQLPRAEVEERSRLLSLARIHVEQMIGRMRTKLHILKSALPVTMYSQVDDVVSCHRLCRSCQPAPKCGSMNTTWCSDADCYYVILTKTWCRLLLHSQYVQSTPVCSIQVSLGCWCVYFFEY